MGSTGTSLLACNPWVARRPLTVHDYHRMGEIGILREDDRVELIEGQLVATSPIGSPHAGTVNALNRGLVLALANRAVVAVQNPVRLDDFSESQPDFSVLKPRADHYRRSLPTPEDVLLIVEVADSSLSYDRRVKLPLYARHGIPELWIVNVAREEVEVYRKPVGDEYAEAFRVGRDGSLEPALLPGATIAVSSLVG